MTSATASIFFPDFSFRWWKDFAPLDHGSRHVLHGVPWLTSFLTGKMSFLSVSGCIRSTLLDLCGILLLLSLYQSSVNHHQSYFQHLLASAQECDGEHGESCLDCGLYLADSTIPNAGYGMFAGRNYSRSHNFLEEIAVSVPDKPSPPAVRYRWKLDDYWWNDLETRSTFDASYAVSSLPGFGMLINSHTKLYNVMNLGVADRRRIGQGNSSLGAFSGCVGHRFEAFRDISAGEELFGEYGDAWFAHRYPDVPLQSDYEAVDEMLHQWRHLLNRVGDNETSGRAGQIWDLLASNITGLNPRMQSFFPKTHADAVAALHHPLGVVSLTAAQYSRSIEWLQQNGMCIDHLQIQPSEHVPYQNGAFVRRPIRKGQRVSPVPLVPTSREHVVMNGTDGKQYQQLLLNYCYGHPDSSLLLVPDAPGVNAINHGSDGHANVALRWSTRHAQQLSKLQQESPHEILKSGSTHGLALELYALRDLQVGEEVLLNYGRAWERAWHRHDREWHLLSTLDKESDEDRFAALFDYESNFPAAFDGHNERENSYQDYSYPSHLQARCWIDVASLHHDDANTWQRFVPAHRRHRLDSTTPCHVVSVRRNHKKGWHEFGVIVHLHSDRDEVFELRVRDVPKWAIAIVDKPYLGQQLQRRAFRHEIHLPDDVFPDAWKDLAPPTHCGLYLAESSIPKAGFGVYTAMRTAPGERISYGDVALPVEDYEVNTRLTAAAHRLGTVKRTLLGRLLENYNWNPRLTVAQFDADHVLNVFPGIGMLAQAHRNFGNAAFGPPTEATLLLRSQDAGAGASTKYHDAHFYASKEIPAGAEVFLETVENGTPKDELLELDDSQTPVRSILWLEENGICLDNIRPRDSTTYQAGKGAFAARPIARGNIISLVPVIPLLRRDLEIFETELVDKDIVELHYIGMQQLINYCYGHSNSSLLFFPYSPGVNYVNHNSKPNAKLRWSNLSRDHERSLSKYPSDFIHNGTLGGLMMEIVALQDLSSGDEIFLDYGDEWSRAWKEFENRWKPTERDLQHIPASLINKRAEWLRTETELEADPYPFRNMKTACFVGSSRIVEGMTFGGGTQTVEYAWTTEEGILDDFSNLFPCDILERNVGDVPLDHAKRRSFSIAPTPTFYKVRFYDDGEGEDAVKLMSSVPREAIRFIDFPYESDASLRTAFRHEIQLPDDMVPDAWLDR